MYFHIYINDKITSLAKSDLVAECVKKQLRRSNQAHDGKAALAYGGGE